MKKAILSLMIIFVFFLLTGGPDFAFANPDENDTQATLADVTWYFDSDGDGDGDPNNSTTNLTGNIFQWQLNSDDCDDTDASIFPGATEIAGDGIDQDCDGKDATLALTWYLDSDRDGFGDATKTQNLSTKPFGYVADNTDCNDTDASIFPGAAEIAGDGIDQDCDNIDTPSIFAGDLKSDLTGGVAPATIKFTAFIAQGTPPFTYDYEFGDGDTKPNGSKNESHTYLAKGTYTAIVSVTDTTGAIFKLSTTIFVTDSTDLDTNQDNLEMDVDQMTKATKADDVHGILLDAQNLIGKTLDSVRSADAALRQKHEGEIQTKAGNLIANTRTKLDDLIKDNPPTAEDLKNIRAGLKGVMSNMVKNGVPVLETTHDELELISDALYKATLDVVLANQNLTPAQIDEIKTDKTKSQAFFQSNPHLLDDVIDVSGIQVDPKPDLDTVKVESIASNHGLTEKQTAELYNAVERTLDVTQKILALSTAALEKTIAEIAEELFNNYSTGITVATVTIDPATQNMLITFSDGTSISFSIKSISIVEDYMPKGLFEIPNGNRLGITDSYAIIFVPYPVFALDLIAEALKLGVDPVLTQDGALQIGTSSQSSLSMKIGWSYDKTNTFTSLTTSFSVVGGADPSAEAYSFLVTYDTGLSQLLPPAAMAIDSLSQMLDTLVPGGYTIDTDTGVITVGTLKLKPDYTFFSLTSIDYTAITAAGGSVINSLAFEFGDFNGNGLSDLKFYSDSPMGYQILWAVSN